MSSQFVDLKTPCSKKRTLVSWKLSSWNPVELIVEVSIIS